MKSVIINNILEDIKRGQIIIIVDKKYHKHSEAWLMVAGELISLDSIKMMKKYSENSLSIPIDYDILKRLGAEKLLNKSFSMEYLSDKNTEPAVIELLTIQKLCSPFSELKEFRTPGILSMIPIKHKNIRYNFLNFEEAAIELVKLSDLPSIAVMSKMSDNILDIYEFAMHHSLKIISIEEISEYKTQNSSHIIREVSTKIPTKYGEFTAYGYHDKVSDEHHIAFVKGNIHSNEPVLTRIHFECLAGDIFSSTRCDCKEKFEYSMNLIRKQGRGIFIYIRNDMKGNSLINKLKSYVLQDIGHNKIQAEKKLGFLKTIKNFSLPAHILKNLKVDKISLITNNIEKIKLLEQYNIQIITSVPIHIEKKEEQ